MMEFNTKKKSVSGQNSKKSFSLKNKILNWYSENLEKLFNLKGSNHSIALGVAFGISVALTPLFGLQIVITILLDIIFKANITASIISSVISNPFTFPFIWLANYKLGSLFFLNDTIEKTSFLQKIEEIKNAITNSNWYVIKENLFSILTPMLIGGIIMAIFFGFVSYIFMLKTLKKYKNNKTKN